MPVPFHDLEELVAAITVAAKSTHSEADTEAKLITPLLTLLGWKESELISVDRQRSTRQSSTAKSKNIPDIYLCIRGTPVIVLEAKRVSVQLVKRLSPTSGGGKDHQQARVPSDLTSAGVKALNQVLRYALDDGIPYAWISNGLQHIVIQVLRPLRTISERVILITRDPQELLAQISQLGQLEPESISMHSDSGQNIAESSTFSLSALSAALKARSSRHLGPLVEDSSNRPKKKFSPAFNVARRECLSYITDFMSNDASLAILTGEAGSGKTSLLCDVFLTLDANKVVPLFIDAFLLSDGIYGHLGACLDFFSSRGDGISRLRASVQFIESVALTNEELRRTLQGGARIYKLLEQLLLSKKTNDYSATLTELLRLFAVRSRNATSKEALIIMSRAMEGGTLFAEIFDLANSAPKAEGLFPRPIDGRIKRAWERKLESGWLKLLSKILNLIDGEGPGRTSDWLSQIISEDWRLFARGNILEFGVLIFYLAHLSLTGGGAQTEKLDLDKSRRLFVDCLQDAFFSMLREPLVLSDKERLALIALLNLTPSNKLTVVLDSINESPNPAQLRADLIALAAEFSGRLAKIIVSCRTPDLAFFTDADRLTPFMYGSKPCVVPSFSTSELIEAWAKYRDLYNISGELGPQLSFVCSNPLMLRLFCEAFADSYVPSDDARQVDVFDMYWSRKVRKGANYISRELTVLAVAEASMRGAREEVAAFLPSAELHSLTTLASNMDAFNALLSEGVIIFSSIDEAGTPGIRFTYEAFHEYVLARILVGKSSEIKKSISSLVRLSRHSRLIRGALEYVLIGIERWELGNPSVYITNLLSNRRLRYLAIAATVKLKDPFTALPIIAKALAGASHEEVDALLRCAGIHLRVDPDNAFFRKIAEELLAAEHDYPSDFLDNVALAAPVWFRDFDFNHEEFSRRLRFGTMLRIATEYGHNPTENPLLATKVGGDCLDIVRYMRSFIGSSGISWMAEIREMVSTARGLKAMVGAFLIRGADMLLGIPNEPDSLWRSFLDDEGDVSFEDYNSRTLTIGLNAPALYHVARIISTLLKDLPRELPNNRSVRMLMSYLLIRWCYLILTDREDEAPLIMLDTWGGIRDFCLRELRDVTSLDLATSGNGRKVLKFFSNLRHQISLIPDGNFVIAIR